MKNKISKLFMLVVLVFTAISLRPIYGAIISVKITFFIGCFVFFIKGLVDFWLKKRGGLIDYVVMLYNKLKIFINSQAHEYKSRTWYKKPK